MFLKIRRISHTTHRTIAPQEHPGKGRWHAILLEGAFLPLEHRDADHNGRGSESLERGSPPPPPPARARPAAAAAARLCGCRGCRTGGSRRRQSRPLPGSICVPCLPLRAPRVTPRESLSGEGFDFFFFFTGSYTGKIPVASPFYSKVC